MPGPGGALASRPKVEIGGTALAANVESLLESIVAEDSLHLPDRLELAFLDSGREVLKAGQIDIGKPIQVELTTPATGKPVKLFEGEITALELEFDQALGTRTIVRAYDKSHRFSRGRRTHTYKDTTVDSIVKQAARRAGVQTGTIDSVAGQIEHASQGNVDDWTFLRWLASEAGCTVAVRNGKLDFAKPGSASEAPSPAGMHEDGEALQLVLGRNLVRLRASVTAAGQVKEVEVRGWDTARKQVLHATAPAKTVSAVCGVKPADLGAKFDAPNHVVSDTPFRTQVEVDLAAKALAEQVASAFAELEGVADGDPRIRAGAHVSIGEVGKPFDGKYTVTTSRHCYDPHEGYRTEFTVSGRQDRSLLGLVAPGSAGGQGGPGGPGGAPVSGVVIGVVSNVKDPEEQGRVKLKLPWLADDYETHWARVVYLGAGPDRGLWITPEPNDEVLVAFELGDLRRPVVLGGLFNGMDKPKVDRHSAGTAHIDSGSGQVNLRQLTSRKGHSLRLVDADGKDQARISLDGDKTFLALEAAGNKVTLQSDGTITIEAKGDLKVKGASVTVESSAALTLKGQTVSIQGSQISIG